MATLEGVLLARTSAGSGSAAGAVGIFVESGGEAEVRAAAAAAGKPAVSVGERTLVAAGAGALLSAAPQGECSVPLLLHTATADEVRAAAEGGAKAVCMDSRESAAGDAVRHLRAFRRAAGPAVKLYAVLPATTTPPEVADVVRMGAEAVFIPGAASSAVGDFMRAAAQAAAPLPVYAAPKAAAGADPFVSRRPPGDQRQRHADWQPKPAPKPEKEGGFSGGWGKPVFGDANAPARRGGYVFLDANTGARRSAGPSGAALPEPEAKRARLPESGGAWKRRFGPSFPHSS